MPKVDLDQDYRFDGVLYRRGRGREVPKAVADRIGAEPTGEGDEPEGYAAMDKDELIVEAENRELEVTRRDGKDGEPLKEDYVAALEAADAG